MQLLCRRPAGVRASHVLSGGQRPPWRGSAARLVCWGAHARRLKHALRRIGLAGHKSRRPWRIQANQALPAAKFSLATQPQLRHKQAEHAVQYGAPGAPQAVCTARAPQRGGQVGARVSTALRLQSRRLRAAGGGRRRRRAGNRVHVNVYCDGLTFKCGCVGAHKGQAFICMGESRWVTPPAMCGPAPMRRRVPPKLCASAPVLCGCTRNGMSMNKTAVHTAPGHTAPQTGAGL